MPNTTNFNWPTPADTDLVKDGAAAIRNLGDGVDTSLVDLKGGTTGQILSKASNADMDFTFITPNVGDITEVQAGTGISVASGTGPIPVVTNTVATAFDAAGDLVYGTGADTFTKLSLGTANQVLTVNSGATAPEWKTPAGGGNFVKAAYGQTSTQVATTSTSYADTGVTATITPASASNDIYVICRLVGYYTPGTNTSSAGVQLLRGATSIAEDVYVFITATGYGGSMEMTMIYKDSPATTSATTYKTQQKVMGTTATITTSPNSMISSIMLLEVTP